jgi:hypothetical protein
VSLVGAAIRPVKHFESALAGDDAKQQAYFEVLPDEKQATTVDFLPRTVA